MTHLQRHSGAVLDCCCDRTNRCPRELERPSREPHDSPARRAERQAGNHAIQLHVKGVHRANPIALTIGESKSDKGPRPDQAIEALRTSSLGLSRRPRRNCTRRDGRSRVTTHRADLSQARTVIERHVLKQKLRPPERIAKARDRDGRFDLAPYAVVYSEQGTVVWESEVRRSWTGFRHGASRSPRLRSRLTTTIGSKARVRYVGLVNCSGGQVSILSSCIVAKP